MNGLSAAAPGAANAVTHDIEEARRYLSWLDPAARAFTFQTVDDNKERSDPALVKVINGTLDEAWLELARLNRAGAGVHVCVNETDLKGRQLANFKRVRAVFCEADDDTPRPFPIPPEAAVESSPGRWHFYWRVNGMTPEQFAAAMAVMCSSYASDKGAKDIVRVLRLPGTLNRKPRLLKPHVVTFQLRSESN